jgi:hypothetical protein
MSFGRPVRHTVVGVGLAAGGIGVYVAAATGRLTVDLGVGRRKRPLGPLEVAVAAPREIVHGVIAEPYLGRQTRAMSKKLQVIERGGDMVVAEHRTPIGSRMVVSTVESVRFTPPERVDFRLLRGPVPVVVESFVLEAMSDGRTLLRYEGTLETDFWLIGAAWGRLVARHWTSSVSTTLASIKSEAERRRSHVLRADR